METLFALVLTVAMTNGDYQDVILGVYAANRNAARQLQSRECQLSAGR